jgi:hypothetical protein
MSLKMKVMGNTSVEPFRAKDPTAMNFEPRTGTMTNAVQKIPVKILYSLNSFGSCSIGLNINC